MMEISDTSDGEEFRGFDEELFSKFSKDVSDITTSTPNKKQSVEDRKRKASDDEATPATGEIEIGEENLSTPERIRRAAQARISQDSGVMSQNSGAMSPEPETDETVRITISEDTNEQVSLEFLRHSDSLSDSNLPILSNHDQQLAAQAQQKYHQQVTDMQTLVEKVNRWHQYLKPILKASQERSEFDIHECGTEVLETFHEESGQKEATFADVMSTKPDDHFARYFLATLMLVNTGNLKITNKNTYVDRISEPSEIHLTLKSRVRLHEEIENMDATVPCISKNIGKKKGKRMADFNQEETSKSKKFKHQASTSSSGTL